MSKGRCKFCGTRVVWLKDRFGKGFLCDSEEVYYRAKKDGPHSVISVTGSVVRCELLDSATDDLSHASGYGYPVHRYNCNSQSGKKSVFPRKNQ